MTTLDLTVLTTGMPGLTPAFGTALAEAAIVCFSRFGHAPGTVISVEGLASAKYSLNWSQTVPMSQLVSSYADIQEATEFGACGVAIALLQKQTGLVVVERSAKGGGFDYYVAEPNWTGDLFQGTSRLEVSGILESPSQIRGRVVAKRKQIGKSAASGLAGFVAVVEFSSPAAEVVNA